MKKTMVLVSIAVFFAVVAPREGVASVFGIKSCGSSSVSCGSNPVNGGGSLPPSVLFQFEEDGSGFSSIGTIQIDSSDADVDALAISPNFGLIGYALTSRDSTNNITGSTLVSIDPTNAQATIAGTELNRDMRGAFFDGSDRLWAIDALHNELANVDPMTGAVISSIGLTLDGNPFDVSTFTDIARQGSGTIVLSDGSNIYAVDLFSGTLSFLASNSGFSYAGLAPPALADASALTFFGFDVSSQDEIRIFDCRIISTSLYDAIIPSLGGGLFNAGRGDLASLSLPNPTSDLDDDGIPDAADNCINVSNNPQRDTDGDGFGNSCDADLNNDCVVNFPDLSIMKAVFFGFDPHADLNGDGLVNFADLMIVKEGFFCPPGPSSIANICP